jgi:hypothetical protein
MWVTFDTERLYVRTLSIFEFREYRCNERYILHQDMNEILSLFKIFSLIYTKLSKIDASGNLMSDCDFKGNRFNGNYMVHRVLKTSVPTCHMYFPLHFT